MRYLLFLIIAVCSGALAAEPAKSKVMLPGGCYVASDVVDKEAFGGFGPSDNKSIPLAAGKITARQPYLQLIEDDGATFDGRLEGVRVRLVNGGASTLALTAQDSRIDLLQEAQDKKGQWRPIEFLPGSWCGNSYHKVYLKSGRAWEFVRPRYSGPFETSIRFGLELSPGVVIYSEPYRGGVDPRQFRKVKQYYP